MGKSKKVVIPQYELRLDTNHTFEFIPDFDIKGKKPKQGKNKKDKK